MMRVIVTLTMALFALLASAGAASACGMERWSAKVLSDGTLHLAGPYDATVSQLISMPRPYGVDGDGPRVAAERTAYRLRVIVERDKLEQDGDIHAIVADPQNPSATMVVEIPDPLKCMAGAPATYVRDVAQTRLAFVRAFGIPPVTHYATINREATIIGPLFFDYEHGQAGAPTNDAEIHPLLVFDNSLSIPIAPHDVQPYRASTARSTSTDGMPNCPGDTVVDVNLNSGIFHFSGSRWFGNLRHGQYMCERAAVAAGYRAARNE